MVAARAKETTTMTDRRRVLFVCPHGAAKSRIAAAWFNGAHVPGWTATSAAGTEPQPAVSPNAVRLLAGTPVQNLLDHSAPRPMSAAPAADLVVTIDCDDTIDGATRWRLTHQQFDTAMADELRDRVQALATELPNPQQP
jgi:protein-tyrosine-phosphatase